MGVIVLVPVVPGLSDPEVQADKEIKEVDNNRMLTIRRWSIFCRIINSNNVLNKSNKTENIIT